VVDASDIVSFRELLDRPLPKAYRHGTHRGISPAETLARVRPLAAGMGITRLGNITGLDRIGIPVAIAVRPNSRSISVSQGKGLDLEQAKASALMEAAEGFHAEIFDAFRRARCADLAAGGQVADLATLAATDRPFDESAEIEWTEGYDLLRRAPCWVPAEIVHTDFTRPLDGYFLAGSNGLASGNHPVEAVVAALCELVERDAVALWQASGILRRAACRLDLGSIADASCRALLARYDGAGFAVRVWNVTSDIAIPAFLCQIRDLAAGDPGRLRRFHGAGCHPAPGIALTRALTEAAQVRLTYIAGIRDDLAPASYQEREIGGIEDALLDALSRDAEPVVFGEVAGFASEDLAEDLRWALDCVRAAGIRRIIACDLTRPEFGIPVVRLVVPTLEGDPRHPSYVMGPRAHRMRAAR
jgi:ribosomal protein S12 methylthiotransferase accessory factor